MNLKNFNVFIPILILTCIIAYSVLITKSKTILAHNTKSQYEQDETPDFSLFNANLKEFNADGVLNYFLETKTMHHFPNKNKVYMQMLQFHSYGEKLEVNITSRNGILDLKNNLIICTNNVILNTTASAEIPELKLTSDSIRFNYLNNMIYTNNKITITSDIAIIEATGMIYNHEKNIISFNADVSTIYKPH